MIPAAFDYVRAGSVDEALAAARRARRRSQGPRRRPLAAAPHEAPARHAGGARRRRPPRRALVCPRGGRRDRASAALTRHHDVERSDLVRRQCGLLAHVAWLGWRPPGPPSRHDRRLDRPRRPGVRPAGRRRSRWAARSWCAATRGDRVVPASEFFRGFLETALAPDELLVEVRVPKTPGARFSYQKFVKRAQDWAIVGAAVVRWEGGTGVGLANMGSTPIRATAVEQALAAGASAADAAAVADEGTSPTADLNASEDYRRHLAKVLVRRGLEAERVVTPTGLVGTRPLSTSCASTGPNLLGGRRHHPIIRPRPSPPRRGRGTCQPRARPGWWRGPRARRHARRGS